METAVCCSCLSSKISLLLRTATYIPVYTKKRRDTPSQTYIRTSAAAAAAAAAKAHLAIPPAVAHGRARQSLFATKTSRKTQREFKSNSGGREGRATPVLAMTTTNTSNHSPSVCMPTPNAELHSSSGVVRLPVRRSEFLAEAYSKRQ